MKYVGSKKQILVGTNSLKNNVVWKYIWVHKNCGRKKLRFKKKQILGKKNLGSKKFWVQKNFLSEKIWGSKKILGPK